MRHVKQLLKLSCMKYLFVICFLGLLVSCDSKNAVEAEIEAIPMEVKIVRFDKEFAQATPASLPSLKRKYPIFFPEQFHDSVWINNINDPLQQQLNNEVAKVFPSEMELEDQLLPLFQHIAYYFPEFEPPTTVTVTSDVDYQNRAIVADTLLVLAIDTYLGADHEFYQNIKKYIAKNLEPSQIGPNVAESYARQLIAAPNQRNLLAQMIYFGKELYLKDLWLPDASDAQKIGYTDAEMQWAYDNEEDMWRYFIEKELLFSTDPKLTPRFIVEAPFSKFYLEIDNESPGMIGRFLGWQIVRSYMENNDTTVKQLMIKSADEIFRESTYKPTKN